MGSTFSFLMFFKALIASISGLIIAVPAVMADGHGAPADGPGRHEEIRQEWKLNTPSKIKALAFDFYDFLSNPDLGLPTVLPDGVI